RYRVVVPGKLKHDSRDVVLSVGRKAADSFKGSIEKFRHAGNLFLRAGQCKAPVGLHARPPSHGQAFHPCSSQRIYSKICNISSYCLLTLICRWAMIDSPWLLDGRLREGTPNGGAGGGGPAVGVCTPGLGRDPGSGSRRAIRPARRDSSEVEELRVVRPGVAPWDSLGDPHSCKCRGGSAGRRAPYVTGRETPLKGVSWPSPGT